MRNHAACTAAGCACACAQVRTFGLSMMALDIRQESTRHAEVIDAVTQYLGMGSYLTWDEDK